MSKQILYTFFGSILLLTSCGSWSDSDKAEYLKICEKNKLNSEFCDCALEKVMANYSDFDSAMEDEEGHAKIFIDCIEKDRAEEEKAGE